MKSARMGILRFSGLIITVFHLFVGNAQTFTAHQNFPIGVNSNGFYDYLPVGYSAMGPQKYPLLIAIHGVGELGNGNTQLVSLTNTGIPQLISANQFPASFTTGTGTYRFIVFAPQFKNIPTLADVDAVVSYAMNNYPVDLSRVYLTGYSMGGGAVWEYAGSSTINGNRFAAVVPVSGAFPASPDYSAARVIAVINLPVWATHNLNDPTVPSSNTVTMTGYINQSPAPVPAAIKTIFNASVHDAWTQTYNPLYVDPNTGLNMYAWMLQYVSRLIVLPVTLSDYHVSLLPNQEVLIEWTTSAEENNRFFTVEKSSDGKIFSILGDIPARNLQTGSGYSYTDMHPEMGDNYYRLSQTDQDGTRRYFQIKKIILDNSTRSSLMVSPNPAGHSIRIQLNFPETGEFYLRLISFSGNLVKSISIHKPGLHWENTIEVSDLTGGMYILQVTGKNTDLKCSVMKE